TPLAGIGIAALAVGSPRLWPTPDWRSARWLMLLLLIGTWGMYMMYTPFDAWWYLRFLLPSWPAMCIGIAVATLRPAEIYGWQAQVLALVVIVLLGVYGIYFAHSHGAFPSGEGDHRYATIAKLVEDYTEPGSVIIAGQNAGPTRYYSGRLT